MKLPVIEGREVVPIRLIPFITHGEYGRKTIADILAHEVKVCSEESLAKHRAEVVSHMAAERRGNDITSLDEILSGDYAEESGDSLDWITPYAYRLNDEGKTEIVPIAEWHIVCLKIKPIIELAHYKEDKIGIEGAKRRKWHKATLRMIPDDAFMWKEDLEKIVSPEKINYNVGIDDECKPIVQAAIDRLNKGAAESSPIFKLPVIGGREVIPVRLIPLIAEPEVSPCQLVECLWNPVGDFLKHLNHSPFRKDWSLVYKELKSVVNSGTGKQLEQFPKGTYVTRADFNGHEYITSKAIRLELNRAIPAPLLSLAFEGFEAPPVTSFINPAPNPCHITAKTLEQLTVPVVPAGEEAEQENARSASELLIPFTHSGLKPPDTDKIIQHYSKEAERLMSLGHTEQDIAIALNKCEYVNKSIIGSILCCSDGQTDEATLAARAYRLIKDGTVFGKRRKKKT